MYRITGALAAVALIATAAPAAAQTAAIKASAAHHAAARAPQKTHVSISANISDYSEAAAEQAYQATLSHKISPRTTLFGGVTQHNNFDVIDAQIQAGVTHVLSPRAVVTGSYTQGIGADVVAGQAVDLKLAGELAPKLRPFVEYNFSRYKETTEPGVPPGEVDEQTFTVGGEIPFHPKTSLSAAYQYSHATDREGAHGGTAFITHHPSDRLSFNAGGSYAGAERLVVLSKFALLRHVETAGLTAGFTWALSSRAELDFTYQFQRVRGFENIHQFSPVITWGF
jgi:YaiO family outer membrane protein